ncbi:uncharacterized protein [Rutidosis leptorrhynchoides]|uniref:uncharacterized protein n=1 Tax=Rutidosis leptorrhynchoides TaxID=125765 RepID=UPI003A98ECF7
MRSHMINSIDGRHHHGYNQHQVNIKSCSSVLDKLCKVCGKGFQSCKALFGHMKCHSIKLSNNKNKNIASFNQHTRTGDSDNENSDVKNCQLKRSRSRSRSRRNKRYMVVSTTGLTTASSSTSMDVNDNNQISCNDASASMVSEIEQEQEAEVAISLMMLSRELGEWGYETGPSEKCNSSVFVNSNLIWVLVNLWIQTRESLIVLLVTRVFIHFKHLVAIKQVTKKLKRDFDSIIENKNKIKHKPNSDHALTINGFDPKTSDDHQESSSFNLGVGCIKKKAVALGAHECPICLKMFSSGQALGGHKRSHLISETRSNRERCKNVIKKPDELVHETRPVFLDLNMSPEEEMNISSSTTEYKSYYWDENDQWRNLESTTDGEKSMTESKH